MIRRILTAYVLAVAACFAIGFAVPWFVILTGTDVQHLGESSVRISVLLFAAIDVAALLFIAGRPWAN